MTHTDAIAPATSHTQEPWEHSDNGLIYGQCREEDVEAPFVCDVIADSAMQALGMLSPVEQANARRIVAAINACQGISTSALEQGAIADLRSALRWLLDDLVDADEDRNPETGKEYHAVANARAALARATPIHQPTIERNLP